MRLKWIATCSSALVLVVALLVAPLASAGTSPRIKGGVIHACMKTKGKKSQRGTIRVVSSAKQCKKNKGEKPLTWSLVGTTGAQGTTGPEGQAGAKGTSGTSGTTGSTGSNGAAVADGTNGATGPRGERGEKGSAATL